MLYTDPMTLNMLLIFLYDNLLQNTMFLFFPTADSKCYAQQTVDTFLTSNYFDFTTTLISAMSDLVRVSVFTTVFDGYTMYNLASG